MFKISNLLRGSSQTFYCGYGLPLPSNAIKRIPSNVCQIPLLKKKTDDDAAVVFFGDVVVDDKCEMWLGSRIFGPFKSIEEVNSSFPLNLVRVKNLDKIDPIYASVFLESIRINPKKCAATVYHPIEFFEREFDGHTFYPFRDWKSGKQCLFENKRIVEMFGIYLLGEH